MGLAEESKKQEERKISVSRQKKMMMDGETLIIEK